MGRLLGVTINGLFYSYNLTRLISLRQVVDQIELYHYKSVSK